MIWVDFDYCIKELMNLHRCKRKTVCECRGVFQRLLNLCAERSQLTILEHHSICAPQPCFLRISIRIAISSRSLVWKTNHNQPYLQTTNTYHICSLRSLTPNGFLGQASEVPNIGPICPCSHEQIAHSWESKAGSHDLGKARLPTMWPCPMCPVNKGFTMFHQLFYNYVTLCHNGRNLVCFEEEVLVNVSVL